MKHDQIERAEVMWRTMTCRDIAPLFGVTPECLRQNFHRWGIKDPKMQLERVCGDIERARRFNERFHWDVNEISAQIAQSVRFVLKALQTSLWPPSEILVERTRMRIVHRAVERVVEVRQLELFSEAA